MSKYDGRMTAYSRLVRTGGSVAVTIASNVGQGNGGTSLACRGCWVVPRQGNTGLVKMNIGAAASASLGIELPEVTSGSPFYVPISDVAELYFYAGNNDDVVDITYLL